MLAGLLAGHAECAWVEGTNDPAAAALPAVGAMRYGGIGVEGHAALAVVVNTIGGKSNSGEGESTTAALTSGTANASST